MYNIENMFSLKKSISMEDMFSLKTSIPLTLKHFMEDKHSIDIKV